MGERIAEADREPDVELRLVSPENAEEYLDLIIKNRGHFSKFGNMQPEKYPTVESVKDALAESSGKTRWAMYAKGVLVGTINIKPVKNIPGTAEIGYLVAEQHGGRGIATTAVKKLIGDLSMYTSFIAVTHPDNVPSRRVLQKAGFQLNHTNEAGDLVWLYKNEI